MLCLCNRVVGLLIATVPLCRCGSVRMSCDYHPKYCFRIASALFNQTFEVLEKACQKEKLLILPDRETELSVRRFVFDSNVYSGSRVLLNLVYINGEWRWKFGSSYIPLAYDNWIENSTIQDCSHMDLNDGWKFSSCRENYIIVCMSLRCAYSWMKQEDHAATIGTTMPFIRLQDSCMDYCEFFLDDCSSVDLVDNTCRIGSFQPIVVHHIGSMHLKRTEENCRHEDSGDYADEVISVEKLIVSHQSESHLTTEDTMRLVVMLSSFNTFLVTILAILTFKVIQMYWEISNVAHFVSKCDLLIEKSDFQQAFHKVSQIVHRSPIIRVPMVSAKSYAAGSH